MSPSYFITECNPNDTVNALNVAKEIKKVQTKEQCMDIYGWQKDICIYCTTSSPTSTRQSTDWTADNDYYMMVGAAIKKSMMKFKNFFETLNF